MKKLVKNKNKGIFFFITGLPGSGKTSIAEKIKRSISKKYGPTITLTGDDLRKIFNYNKFSRKPRLAYALSFSKFCKYITDKKINVIFSTVSLFHKVRKWNKLNIQNYIEIYIEVDINQLIKIRKKFFYKGNYKNVYGKDLRAEFPKNPNIIINNNFNKSIKVLTEELFKKIKKIVIN